MPGYRSNVLCTSWLFGFMVLCTFFFVSFEGSAQAQQYSISNKKAIKDFERARTAFDGRNAPLAISLLDDALKREPKFVEAQLMRFEVFADQGKLTKAMKALQDAVEINPDFFPNAWFFLGDLEYKEGLYEKSMKSHRTFLQYRATSPELREMAQTTIDQCLWALEAMKNPVAFEPVNMGPAINSELPEYYPCLTADGQTLLYTRLVNDPEAFRGKQEDFFISQLRDGEWEPSRAMHEINTSYNEGAPSMSADGRILVFTACETMGDYGHGRKGFGSCDLFISEREGGRWSIPKNIGNPINTKAWESQPSLSADGRTLYFIRGQQTRRGVKNQDIYVSERLESGKWSIPKPLGPEINTPGREESVMIHPDGTSLYFSSDGHPGMGGLDLFVSRKQDDGSWGRPQNLGYPINTHKDENSLLVGPDGRIALFASDREGGFGGLDLYSFELHKDARPTPVTYARGRVLDDATGRAVQAELRLYDLQKPDQEMRFRSDAKDGSFMIALPKGHSYGLAAQASGYLFHSEQFELLEVDDQSAYQLEIRLKKPEAGAALVLRNVFFDTDKDLLKPESKMELQLLADMLMSNPDMKIEVVGHTDSKGDPAYNKDLSARRAQAVKSYLQSQFDVEAGRMRSKGMGEEQPIASNDTEEGRALNRRTEIHVLPGD